MKHRYVKSIAPLAVLLTLLVGCAERKPLHLKMIPAAQVKIPVLRLTSTTLVSLPPPYISKLTWEYDPSFIPLVEFQVEGTQFLPATCNVLGLTTNLIYYSTNYADSQYFRVGVHMKIKQ